MTNSISSNLDVNSLVSAMLKPKEAKISKTNNEIKSYETKISNIGKVKSSIDELKNKLSEINNEKDVDKAILKIKEFTSTYNSFIQTTKDSKDLNLQSFNINFRKELSSVNMGVSFNKNGVMIFQEDKLDKSKQINGTLDNLIGKNSSISKELESNKIENKVDVYKNKLSALNKQNDNDKTKLTDYEILYRKKFNNLQSILSKLESNSSSLNIKE